MRNHPFYSGKKQRPDQLQERELAKSFGGRRTPASGATPLIQNKADVHSNEYVFEAKCTSKKSFSVKLSDLRKIQDIALQNGKCPVFVIRFDTEEVSVFAKNEWAMVPLSVFKELVR